MAPKSANLLLFAALSMMAVTVIATDLKLGIFVPIEDLNDPKVAEMAKFAVLQHNLEENSSLEFERVEKGDVQMVSSISLNYRLLISAKDGAATHTYSTIVNTPPGNKALRLYSFTQQK